MTQNRVTSQLADNGATSVSPFEAGKNKIINGDFGIWQRGTSGFATGGAYNADRWRAYCDNPGATYAISQQPLSPGAIVGVDSSYCWQLSQTGGSGGSANLLYQLIENVQTLEGQTATLSFYAKSDATRTALAPVASQQFGTGGSSAVVINFVATSSSPVNLTTSWQRFSYTATFPSISGKTIGTNSYVEVDIKLPINTSQVTQVVGVQLEAGSVATPFTTATGTIQGELAACQRYYYRSGGSAYTQFASGFTTATTAGQGTVFFPVNMRVAPTALDSGGSIQWFDTSQYAASSLTLGASETSTNAGKFSFTVSGATANRPGVIRGNNDATSYIGWSAEL